MISMESMVRSLAEREDLLAEIRESDRRASPRGAPSAAEDEGLSLLLARMDLEEEGRSLELADLLHD